MCKYKKECDLYDKTSNTCNYCLDIDNHCGKFKDLEYGEEFSEMPLIEE